MAKEQSFRYLWVGQSLANCGDVFYVVGLMTVIYGLTRSAFDMSLVPFLTTASRFVSGLIAPLILDRLGLKGSLVFSQTGKTGLLLILAITLHLSVSENVISFLLLFVFLISFLDGWASPARNAMIPILIEKDHLVRANGFLSVLDQSINLCGWAAGGVLAAVLGGSGMIWLTLLLFLPSTFMMIRIRLEQQRAARPTDSPGGKWHAVREGWVAIWNAPVLRVISIVDVMGNIASVVWMAAIVYVFVQQILHVDQAWWGYINFFYFAGLIIGGYLCVHWSAFIDHHLKKAALTGLAATAIVTLLFGWNSFPLLALLLSALIGVSDQLKEIAFTTITQRSAEIFQLGKIYSAKDAASSLCYGLATLLFGYLSDSVGVRQIFIISAGILAASFIYAVLSRNALAIRQQH
jgi:Arabinose efflux permease